MDHHILPGLLTVLFIKPKGDRELIGTFVSYMNDCFFCQSVHGAMAGHCMGCSLADIEAIKKDFTQTDISPIMKTLIVIAVSVQKCGKQVTTAQIDAAFCMFNRYVDGLGTWAPQDQQVYTDRLYCNHFFSGLYLNFTNINIH